MAARSDRHAPLGQRWAGRVAVLAAIGAVALAAAGSAGADDATPAQVQALARRAAGDPAALARLERVTSVGGRPVDIGGSLAGASGADLHARLRALAAGGAISSAPGDPRAEAQAVLRERRFRGSSVPRPFHGILHWLGEKLAPVARPFRWLSRRVPGGSSVLWIVLAAVVVAAAVIGGRRVAARNAGRLLEAGGGSRRGRRLDPARLERDADEAERRGDLETALRLRFRAGLLRLGQARAVPLRDSLTSGEVARLVPGDAFARLAGDFDEVVYGRLPAEPRHLETARADWPRVLEEASR